MALQWVQEAILSAETVPPWLTTPHKTHTRSRHVGKGVFPSLSPFLSPWCSKG